MSKPLSPTEASVPAAREALLQAQSLSAAATERERMHIAALAHWTAGDLDATLGTWEQILDAHPLDERPPLALLRDGLQAGRLEGLASLSRLCSPAELGGLLHDPALRTALLLTTAMPMMGVYPILAQKHGHEGVSAAALLVCTVASFFTLSALLWALRVVGWMPV